MKIEEELKELKEISEFHKPEPVSSLLQVFFPDAQRSKITKGKMVLPKDGWVVYNKWLRFMRDYDYMYTAYVSLDWVKYHDEDGDAVTVYLPEGMPELEVEKYYHVEEDE
jgi:hypothetical protein